MFKKIQNYLLLNHPLLWNVKIVPLAILMLCLHIIFFITGYIHGVIDFSDSNDLFSYDATGGIVIFISVFLSILIGVIWIVFYFRNNAFKSFYPKNNHSLFKEWLLLLVICIINCTYSASFLYANDLRARNYFSEEEFSRRIDVISMAALFAEGSFEQDGDSIFEKDGENVQIHKDYFIYKNKRYGLKSLLNKSIVNFSYQEGAKDSLNDIRVKNWLANNQKDSVLWVMSEFEKIAISHKAFGNINAKQWLEHVYDEPEFTNYLTIGRNKRLPSDEPVVNEYSGYGDNYAYEDIKEREDIRLQDTASNVIQIINGRTYIFPKYYVPLKQMEKAYEKISTAWTNPEIAETALMLYGYFGLALSLLIFSFRVTSGRNWLIAMLAFGIVALLSGIVNLMLSEFVFPRRLYRANSEYIYFGFWLLLVGAMVYYFYSFKQKKGISGIIVNILLWLMPWVLPVIILFIDKYIRGTIEYKDGIRITPKSAIEIWIRDYPDVIMGINCIIFILFMYFFTISIKKWKGIAEA